MTPVCLVCGCKLLDVAPTSCPRCDTPHHPECWSYNAGCAVYACNPGTKAVIGDKPGAPRRAGPRGFAIAALSVLVIGMAGYFIQELVSTPGRQAKSRIEERSAGEPNAQSRRTGSPVTGKLARLNPTVQLETSHGRIELELYENEAPNTVANFISLVESGLYDGTHFHRILRDFMMQGGDPLTKQSDRSRWGTGGPGYCIDDEIQKAVHGHVRGAIAMANAGPNTNGSQFFIMFKDEHFLDGRHTVFGRVIEGMDVVGRIEKQAAVGRDPDPPREPVVLIKATVLTKQPHAYVPVRNRSRY